MRLAKQQGFNINEEFFDQAVRAMGPDAVPADIVVEAFKLSKQASPAQGGLGAVKPPSAAPVVEPPEGRPPVNEFQAEHDRRVNEYVDQGIPQDQAEKLAADEMQSLERQRPPAGKGIEGQFMPDFYSKASRAVEANPQGKWDADQLRGFLKGKGISENEMEWSGIKDLQGKLTKEQALQAIQLPKVIETKLGGATSMNETARDLYGCPMIALMHPLKSMFRTRSWIIQILITDH